MFFKKSWIARLGPVWAPWYLREILRARFSAKTTPSRAANLLPAIARWGVVQLVGHLTVNEDGEGSNPSAPQLNLVYESCRAILYGIALLISNDMAVDSQRDSRVAVAQLSLHDGRSCTVRKQRTSSTVT